MVADSLAPETETRTKPKPDDSTPAAEPVGAPVETSAIALEPLPTPPTITPPPPAIEPAVPELRHEETVRVELVTAPKTSEERAWGLGFFALVTLMFGLAAAAALSWNWRYVDRFLALPSALGRWTWPAFPLPAFPAALLATIQMVALGAVAYRFLFPRRDRKSTRLNSSHLVISYAVFCLKKKNII